MTIEGLKAAGGEEWQRGDKHVVVFNVSALCQLIDLEVERGDSGRITGGKLNGRPLSNIGVRKIYAALQAGRFFYDIKDKHFHYDPMMEEYAKRAISVLRGESMSHTASADAPPQPAPKLARRLRKNEPLIGLKSGKFTNVRDLVVEGPNDVAEIYRELKNADREKFIVLALDQESRLLGTEVVSMGTLNYNLVHPREVFKTPILLGADKIICLHNHPSGTNQPSDEDLALTKRLRACGEIVGVGLAYHVIIANNEWSAIHNDGRIESERLSMTETPEQQTQVPVYEVYQKTVRMGSPILKPRDAVEAAKAIFAKDVKSEVALMLNTRNEVLTIMDIKDVQNRDLWKRTICVNAAAIVICTGEKYETEKRSRLVKESKTFGIEVLDIVEVTGRDASGELQQISYKQNGTIHENRPGYAAAAESDQPAREKEEPCKADEPVVLKVWNQHLISKTEGLPELKEQHMAFMSDLTEKINEMPVIEPEVKCRIVSALNSPEGAKLVARHDENPEITIYGGLCMAEGGDTKTLDKYPISPEVKQQATAACRTAAGADLSL